MLKRALTISLPLFLLAGLAACQSTGSGGTANTEAPRNRCEQLKQQSFYNTVEGRTVANATCAGIYEKMSSKDANQWSHREYVRQKSCKVNTGKLCED